MPLALAELLIRRCRPCFRPGARRLLRSLADVECSPSSSFAAPRRPVGLAPVMAPDFCLISRGQYGSAVGCGSNQGVVAVHRRPARYAVACVDSPSVRPSAVGPRSGRPVRGADPIARPDARRFPGSSVAGGHRGATRSALDAGDRRADCHGSGRRLRCPRSCGSVSAWW